MLNCSQFYQNSDLEPLAPHWAPEMSQGISSFCSAGGQGSEVNNNLFLLVKFYWWTFVNTDLGTTITIPLTMTMMVAILVIIMIVIMIILIIVVMLIILIIIIIPPVRHKIPTDLPVEIMCMIINPYVLNKLLLTFYLNTKCTDHNFLSAMRPFS